MVYEGDAPLGVEGAVTNGDLSTPVDNPVQNDSEYAISRVNIRYLSTISTGTRRYSTLSMKSAGFLSTFKHERKTCTE